MADVRKREKIAREIEKTSESIRKKHRALKTSRIEEGRLALDRHFKLLFKPLQLVDSFGVLATKRESRDESLQRLPLKVKGKKKRNNRRKKKRARCSSVLATLHKSNDRSHDRVQPITSKPRAKIDDRVVGERFRNDSKRLASNEDSKSVANVRKSRGVTSWLEPAGSKIRRGCPEGSAR